MVFCKGDEDSINRVLEALNHFSAATRLIANRDKSHMFVAGVRDQVKAQLLEKTGFAQGTFPIRYLGLPLSSKKWSKLETTVDQQDYKPDNNYLCKTIIICWKATIFILPQSILKKVNRKCREYLWGKTVEQKKTSLVSWDKVCLLKSRRGLNVKDCRTWNIASMVGGRYSITKSYLQLKGEHNKMEVADLIWNSVALPKYRFHVWLVVYGRLLTKERLLRLHIPVENPNYYLCDHRVMEKSTHLFVDRNWITSLRVELTQWINVQLPAGELKYVLECIKRKRWKEFSKELIAAVWGAMTYQTLRARNYKVFKDAILQPIEVATQIKREIV
ncbi:uncharacterized protein LOC142169947 [Nicotiana tabacum]|uniref:Uncharacterized protein LOC142169947 n=1 Tax=Nicotiana tabacum TaxID=4097 RepID=A0AC58SSP2_TOBAC